MTDRAREPVPWYRVPVLWLAALALLASVLGCGLTIGIALRQPEAALGEVAPGSRFQLPPVGEPGTRP